MPRIAWFTPLPPAKSGISQYNIELLPGLTPTSAIDVFVGDVRQIATASANPPVYGAHDFVWKHARQPYDLIVYHLGNAAWHDYMWGYLVRYPGLVVLHDGQLHHARARSLLEQKREDDYRTEFQFNHPGAEIEFAELGIAGLLGSLTYLWPMRRVVLEAARLVVVHNHWLAEQILQEHPNVTVRVIDMGVPDPIAPADARAIVRARHQIPSDAMLFMAFGEVTPEKRIPQAIRALASILEEVPNAHLLLVGQAAGHYDARAEARTAGVDAHVTVAGFVPHEEIAAYLATADVCLCMRWPTSRETSAAWLRCLAAGRSTVITDLAHMVDIPALDPRSWTLQCARPASPDEAIAPIPTDAACISIDILDEDHSLRLAMRRLATDDRMRAALGQRARQLWLERFTLDRMVANYAEALDAACQAPLPGLGPASSIPRHFVTDGTEYATRRLRQLGLPESRIAQAWRLATK